MPAKRVQSVKNELLKKAREAVLSAVQIYNNPQICFKTEAFITLSVIGWTYLLHAYYRTVKIDYRYFKIKNKKKVYDKTNHGAYKHWELERCINEQQCPLDNETKLNLRFLIGIRHEIEHQKTEKIDEYISAKLQACAINFDYYISTLFDKKHCLNKDLALSIQFSPLLPEEQDLLTNNKHITSNVRNFITDFESSLEENSLTDTRYAYRVLFVPINTNRQGQADQVIEFVKSDSPLAENVDKNYAIIKETEKEKYLPSQILEKMIEKGFTKFTMVKHTKLWQEKNAKDFKKGFGVYVAKQWYWYKPWLDEVLQYCENHKDELSN